MEDGALMMDSDATVRTKTTWTYIQLRGRLLRRAMKHGLDGLADQRTRSSSDSSTAIADTHMHPLCMPAGRQYEARHWALLCCTVQDTGRVGRSVGGSAWVHAVSMVNV